MTSLCPIQRQNGSLLVGTRVYCNALRVSPGFIWLAVPLVRRSERTSRRARSSPCRPRHPAGIDQGVAERVFLNPVLLLPVYDVREAPGLRRRSVAWYTPPYCVLDLYGPLGYKYLLFRVSDFKHAGKTVSWYACILMSSQLR